MRKQREIKKINKQGRCEAYDLNCKTERNSTSLIVEIDDYKFCCEKCANDFWGELTEGCYQPFPNARGALAPEQITDNQIEAFDRYEREYS